MKNKLCKTSRCRKKNGMKNVKICRMKGFVQCGETQRGARTFSNVCIHTHETLNEVLGLRFNETQQNKCEPCALDER